MIEFSINESLSEDKRQEPHPFAEVPGLEDCPLAGLKSALTRQHLAEAPTDRQTALWTQPRGGTEERAVKTYRIDSIYTGPERSGTSTRGGTEEPAVKTYRIDSIYTGPERSGTSSRGGTEERAVKTYRIDSIYTGPERSGTSSRGGTEERAVKTYRIDSIYTGPERSGTSSRGGTEERAVKTYRIDSIYTGPERSGTSTRGGTEERAVKTYRIDSIYTGPEESGTSAFSPLDLPQDLPLSVQQWQTDKALKKQQRLFGSTARALSKGLERMERPRIMVRPGACRQD